VVHFKNFHLMCCGFLYGAKLRQQTGFWFRSSASNVSCKISQADTFRQYQVKTKA